MLTADDVQKWLEQARALPGEAHEAEPAKDRTRTHAVAVSSGRAAPGGRGATVLVLRDPVRDPGPESVLAAMGAEREPERPRWPWALTLVMGLVSGLALGVGVVGFAGSARPWLASVLGPEPAPAGDRAGPDDLTAVVVPPTEAAVEAAPADPLPPDAAPVGAGVPDPAPPRPVLPDPAARPGPVTAGPLASDAAPPAPRLVDPPRDDPRAVLVQADRRPLRRRPAPLAPPEPDGGAALLVASAPAGADPWRPVAPLAPEPDAPVRLASAVGAAAGPGPASALAPAPLPDAPPPPEVGEAAMAIAASPAGPPLRVALHLAPTLPQTAIHDAQVAVAESGFDLTGTSLARFGVARSEVRFFHEDDAAGAARIAERLGAQARDFSAFRPAPPPGSVEVWLAPAR